MSNLIIKSYRWFSDEILKIQWIILGVILYLFGTTSKDKLYYFSVQTELSVNKWDLLYSFISNVYLIAYVILPLLLYKSITIIIADFEYTALIRLRSYQKWIFRTLKSFVNHLGVIATIWSLVILILLISVPPFLSWSPFSQLNHTLSESQILEKFIGVPLVALFLQLFLFTATMITIHLVLSVIYVISKSKGIVIAIAISIWLYNVVSFRFTPENLFFLDLSNYLMLHWGASGFGSIWVPPLIVVTFFILTLWFISKIDLNFKVIYKGRVKWSYMIFPVIIGVVLWMNIRAELVETIWDQLIVFFIGGTQNGFNIRNYLTYFIIYIGFIYLTQLYLQKLLREIGYYSLLRYHSANKWFWSWFKTIMIYTFAYLVSLSLISLMISLMSGGSTKLYISLDRSIAIREVLYHFFVNGFLQLTFYILFVFLIAWLYKEAYFSFVGIGILSLFMFPGINTKLIIPYGLNSIGLMLEGYSIYYISLILCIWNLIIVGILAYIFNKKDIDL